MCVQEFDAIAGYAPGSNVTEHNALDGDQAAMETALETFDFALATTHYATGGSSNSGSSKRAR